jgi:hypothetical protein
MLEGGVSISSRYSANVVAFSLSLFSQLLFHFLICGIDIWGVLNIYVEFQIVWSPLERDAIECSNVLFLAFFKALCRFRLFFLPLTPVWERAPILEHRADFISFLIIDSR